MARYQRQLVLPEVGIEGQRALLDSRVLIVGAGALGSAAATYLAAAGVGTLGLVDGDRVDLSNLHRQILHDDRHLGMLKTQSGAERLRSLNPGIHVVEHAQFVDVENILPMFSDYDAIVNGSDNFPTRYLVNDAAVFLKKPLVDAAVLKFEGQLAVFRPGLGCYRCLFPAPPPPGSVPNCAEAGILGAIAGVLGSMQAVETLKLLLGLGPRAPQTLRLYDGLNGTWQQMAYHRDATCPVCGDAPSITELIDYEGFCRSQAPSGVLPSVAIDPSELTLTVDEAAGRLDAGRLIGVDVRRPDEFYRGHIPGTELWALEDLDLWIAEHGDQPVLMICTKGIRSAEATQYLRSQGCPAWSLAGGAEAWTSAGRPWIQGPA